MNYVCIYFCYFYIFNDNDWLRSNNYYDYLWYDDLNLLYSYLIDVAAMYMIKPHIRMLGDSLLINTPIIDPMNIIGMETNAYWYWIIGY